MKRFEVLFDENMLAELKRIADDVGTTQSYLIRKAVRLYLENRKPKNPYG